MNTNDITLPKAWDKRRSEHLSDADTIDATIQLEETWRHIPQAVRLRSSASLQYLHPPLMAGVGCGIGEDLVAFREDRSAILLAVEEHEMDNASADQGGQRSESESAVIDEACSRFETAWRAGQQPRIEEFLPTESPDKSGTTLLNVLVQLVGIDLEWRWKTADMVAQQETVTKKPSPPAPLPQAGEGSTDAPESSVSFPLRPRLADYVARYALLGPVEQLPCDLIVNEYYARRRYGDQPTHAEYLDVFGSRHPDLAKQLRTIDDGMAAVEHHPSDLLSEDGPPLDTTMQQFGEYVLLDKLGEGGMGVVFKAQHRRMKRFVAVKMIARREIGSPDAVKRFYREVEAAAKLNHPNIVTAYDASEHEGAHYLAMEYVEGKDLAAVVQERGPLPIAQAVDYVIQAARGLQYAHKHQMVHRDIKPSNLMLDKEGTVKILDMGLASIAGLAEDSYRDRLTGTGQVMGTLDYMAPEQALDAHHADARADIYSLGCTLYRLLTGEVLFKCETLAKIIWAHQQAPIPSLCKARTDVPPQLDAAFQKMVAKKPEDRYQSMTEVIIALETCAGKRGVTATLVGEDATAAFPMADNPAVPQGASPGGTATVAKKKVERLAEETLSQQAAAAETSKHLGRDAKLLAAVRKKKTLAVAVGLGLLGVAGIIVLSVILRVHHPDGKDTVVKVPEGSNVSVGKDGQVDVTLPSDGGKTKADTPPLPSVGSLLGPDGKWRLPPGAPPLAVAPFDAKKATEHQEAWAKHLGVPIEITNSIGMKLVLIPPGAFDMGSPKELIEEELKTPGIESFHLDWYGDHLRGEGPQHRVRITKPFYFGVYVVTQEEYQRVMGSNPSEFCATGGSKNAVEGQDTKRFPVESVSWDQAVAFCRKLSEMPAEKAARRTYRLPSEAQWEYACRAGSTGRYSFSLDAAANPAEYDKNTLSDYGWFGDNSGGRTNAAGGKRPSAWGLYDMHGNLFEWCEDWYDKDYYATSPTDDPSGPLGGSARVSRGGSWHNPAWQCRSAHRHDHAPGMRVCDLGFRVSLALPERAAERAAVPVEPIVPAKPVHLDLKPDAKAWDLKTGSPLNSASLVVKPAVIKGLRSWTLETCASRGDVDGNATGQLSPDDHIYAVVGRDGVIRLLDPATGKLRIALVNPEPGLTALTWSPDNVYLAVGCGEGVIRIWNVVKGTLVLGPTSSSTKQINCLAWSPDGTLLAVGRNGDSAVMLWDVRKARQSKVLQEQADVNRSVNFLAWSADGKRLMVTTDLAVRIWDVAGTRLVQTVDSQNPKDTETRRAAAWSPDGKRIATLCSNSIVKFFDATYNLVLCGNVGSGYGAPPFRVIAWSPDGLHLACTCYNDCQILNTVSASLEFEIGGPFFGESSRPAWSKDSARLLCTHVWSGTVTAMDAHSGKPLWRLAGKMPYDGYDTNICISPDGRQYATAVWWDRLYTWDAMQGLPVYDYGPILFQGRGQIIWSKDGRLAVTGGGEGARIWDPGKPGPSHLYRDGGYWCAAWSPDGKTLARGGRDVLVLVLASGWEDPHQVFHADAWNAEVRRLAWFDNNSTLAAGLDNNKVVILEMPSGKVLKIQQFPAIKKARENGGDCGGVFVNPGGGQTIST